MSFEFKFHELYENGCIHNSKSIGTIHIIVNLCVSHRREAAEWGNNIIGPCGTGSKSFYSLDGFSQRKDIKLSGTESGL